MKAILITAIMLSLAQAACAALPFAAGSAPGRICFESGGDIWTVNADGSDPANLTATPDIDEVDCRWSFDGTRLVFASAAPGDLYVMDADGSGRKQITEGVYARRGSWAPDGRHILLVASTLVGEAYINDLRLLDLKSGNMRTIIDDSQEAIIDAAFSPDGSRIAVGLGGNIYVMAPDGADRLEVSRQSGGFRLFNNAQWSPDGRRIMFHGVPGASAQNPSPHIDMYVVNADGSGLKQITDGTASSYCASFSPDGRRIAFISDRQSPDLTLRLYVANPDGSDARMILDQYANCSNWQPAVP